MTIKVTVTSPPKQKVVKVECPECGHCNFESTHIKIVQGEVVCRRCEALLHWEEFQDEDNIR